jgi:glycosyltransferase involved in cell wall biosynthesis
MGFWGKAPLHGEREQSSMVTDQPAISVIMPAYNAENYLKEAVESVFGQTWKDWELIVVDDGSTDSTRKILAAYEDRRFIVIHQSNRGEAEARNTGLRRARGEFVCFLDADDVFLPNALADRTSYLRAHPNFGALVADGKFCDPSGTELRLVSSIQSEEYVGRILEPLILDPSVVRVPSGITVRRDLIRQHNLWFDPEVGYGTDWDFWTQLARFTEFGFLPTPTFRYRIHGANMTTTQPARQRDWLLGRMKTFNAPWFGELSEATRFKFLQMLVLRAPEDLALQQTVLNSPQASKLPRPRQARLWSNAASRYLSLGIHRSFAIECLQRASSLAPFDLRSRFLSGVVRLGGPWAELSAKFWLKLVSTLGQLLSLGRRSARPVPAELSSGVNRS